MPEFYSLGGEKAILCGKRPAGHLFGTTWAIYIELPRIAALLLKPQLPD